MQSKFVTFTIQGMHCQACVARVARAIEKVPDARVASVSIGSAIVDTSQPEAVAVSIAKAGYPAQPADLQA
jgi:copper chaperone CopZ